MHDLMISKSSKFHVLHLVEYLYLGGIEKILEQFSLHPSPKFELFFYSYETEELAGIGKNIQERGGSVFFSKKVGSGYSWKLLLLLITFVKNKKIDIIHTHDFGPMEYAVGLKIFCPHLKLIHTQHTLAHFLKNKKYVFFFQIFSHFYDCIVFVSRHVERSIMEKVKYLHNKRKVIYNGVDVNLFSLTQSFDRVDDDESDKNYTNGKKLKIIGLSRISTEKNLIFLMNALKELKEKGVNFEYRHAGQGSPQEENYLRQLIKDYNLEAQIKLCGFVLHIQDLLQWGEIFISCSLTEGHPVALLEAMAAGKICLCSDIPPHREIALEFEAIEFFSLEGGPNFLCQKIIEIGYSKENWLIKKQMTQKIISEYFSLEKMINHYHQLYAH